MTYIKLLTALAGLALLTACGGAAAPKTDNTGGDTTTNCTTNAFHADCDADAPAIALRQSRCLADATANPACTGAQGIIAVFCKDAPFSTETPCMAATYLPERIAECISNGNADETRCGTVFTTPASKACLTNPFSLSCETDGEFGDYADDAKTNRASFCDDSANVADGFCTGAEVGRVCGFDPFTAICPDDTYATPRQEACLMDITTNPACMGEMGIATVFCKANPFDTSNACMADTYLPERIAECIADGNADDPKCPMLFTATASKACLTNPFTDACKTDGDFGTYADDARMNRITFCETMGNERDTLCMNTNLMNLCVFNPFSTACTGHPDTPDLQVASCRDDGNDNKHSTCGEVLLVKENDLPAYPALPAVATPVGFLEGGTAGISTTGFTPVVANSGSLNATATAGTGEAMVSLGGAATDGVAWTRINFTDVSADGFYAGIFSGTDMGAVLVKPAIGTKAKVDWKGIIQGTDNTLALDARPFTLNVDLYNRTLKAFVLHLTDSSTAFSIDGEYDAKGLISGTTLFGFYANRDIPDQRTLNSPLSVTGTLTGLIGAKGAVGAFHGDTTSNAYSGGFIANYTAPPPPNPCIAAGDCVDTAAWLTALTTTPPDTPETPRKNQFLKGTSTGFADGANANIRKALGDPDDVIAIKTIEFANTDTAAGGFAYFGGALYANNVFTNTQFYYAGVLAGTNLGAPITQVITAEAGVRWTGKIRADGSDGGARLEKDEVADFGLNITFDGTRGTLKTFFETEITHSYSVNGVFDANGIIISGTVANGSFTGSRDAVSTISNNYSTAALSGIIGQDGVVGVFYNNPIMNSNGASFSGGFYAVPPVVNTGDLPTYPTKPNAETSTRFLTATETGLNITDIQFQGSATRTILTPHFIGRRGLDSNNPDGFAYFVTTSALLNPIGYVGILPTTNLGAPLIAQPANAVWAGHFSVAGANNIATNYFVDFTNGKFGFSNAAEDDTDGTLTVRTATYTMNAHFGSHASANGYSAGRMGGTISILDAGTTGSATIVGLIGAEGAVGVFTQEGAATGYIGGFTATNPN